MGHPLRLAAALAALVALTISCGAPAIASPARRSPTASAASCVGLTPAQQLRAARTVMIGVMLRGPTVLDDRRRVLASPARMRVVRYVKGHGPRVVRVLTAVTPRDGGVVVAEDGIEARAGERWRIDTSSRRMPFQTSVCGGSRRLSG